MEQTSAAAAELLLRQAISPGPPAEPHRGGAIWSARSAERQSEQDALAALVLEELASEERWSASFAESQDLLASLADEALAEHAAGQTKPL